MLNVSECNEWLSLDKSTTKPMKWVLEETGKNNRNKYSSSIELFSDGSVIESMLLKCSYLPETEDLEECFSNAVIFNKQRIYAIDVVHMSKRHKNKKGGRGRKFYNQVILGSHEHTWSNDGEGYAEPLSNQSLDHLNIWQLFEKRTNIKIKDGYTHPLQTRQEQYMLQGLTYGNMH